MIRSIQLKQIYRNKRFLFFTIMVPSFYYIFMILMYKNNNQANFQQIINETLLPIYCECVLLGIVSNSLLTFGSKISSTRKFYSLYNRITTYTIHQFLVDQIMIQIIANLTISTLITLVGFGFQVLSFNWQTLLLFLLLNILGIYFTVIGFFYGSKNQNGNFSNDEYAIDTTRTSIYIALSSHDIRYFNYANHHDSTTISNSLFLRYLL
ncbi:hypothetical protein [Holzapfeliella floricola]|uniref:hypothetical protein n=1 Tax=Holzapfeliella floricola TaxID=679249 RepID=UPI0007853AB4|nr:hypothetical protein [Holzapfeliella floricola]